MEFDHSTFQSFKCMAKISTIYTIQPLSSLVDGDDGFIGPGDKLLCLLQTQKNYIAQV